MVTGGGGVQKEVGDRTDRNEAGARGPGYDEHGVYCHAVVMGMITDPDQGGSVMHHKVFFHPASPSTLHMHIHT